MENEEEQVRIDSMHNYIIDGVQDLTYMLNVPNKDEETVIEDLKNERRKEGVSEEEIGLYERADKLAISFANYLLEKESGTVEECYAEWLHDSNDGKNIEEFTSILNEATV